MNSKTIGEEVIKRLHALDDVAYVRFASVYHQFKDLNEFMVEVNDLITNRKNKVGGTKKKMGDTIPRAPQSATMRRSK